MNKYETAFMGVFVCWFLIGVIGNVVASFWES